MSVGTGLAGQQGRGKVLFDASGSLASAGCVLALGQSSSRSFLYIQNTGSSGLSFEFGPARATCTISNGVVNAVTITNAGQGYSYPPTVEFLGGGGKDPPYGNSLYLGIGQDGGTSPASSASGVCVMTGTAPNMSVASITINSGGKNYACPPYVLIKNRPTDPYGVATAIAPVPSTGVFLAAGQSMMWTAINCPIDQISVAGAIAGQWCLKWSS